MSGVPDQDQGILAAFAKAESREPLFGAALGFVPAESRALFRAWVGLLSEVRECAFELSDPRVTAVKAGWWAEELDGVARGAARHPLTRALVRHGGPWRGLGDALLTVSVDDAPRSDREAAIAALRPLAEPLAAIEGHLFGARIDVEAQARALAIHWLRTRLERGLDAADRARVPLSQFARHGLRREQLATAAADALRRDWASELRAALPIGSIVGWAYPRIIELHADQRCLQAFSAGRSSSRQRAAAFLDVWHAWRLARNAALRAGAAVVAPT
ncbi:MAG: hypothetical protein ACRC2H_04340 [Silanimonas sp.]